MAERSNAPVSRSGIRKDARVRIPLLALLIIKLLKDGLKEHTILSINKKYKDANNLHTSAKACGV
jgi:hypothetical protein